MKQEHDLRRLNLRALGRESGALTGDERLARFDRLMDETRGLGGETMLHYSARVEIREDATGSQQVWLHLAVELMLPLVCQRCLGPVEVPLAFARSFRFAATEEQAAAEDELSEEDVLVLSPAFDLFELMEDEVLMDLPVAPMHDVCPEPVKLRVADAGFDDEESEQPHPFAVLQRLKKTDLQ